VEFVSPFPNGKKVVVTRDRKNNGSTVRLDSNGPHLLYFYNHSANAVYVCRVMLTVAGRREFFVLLTKALERVRTWELPPNELDDIARAFGFEPPPLANFSP